MESRVVVFVLFLIGLGVSVGIIGERKYYDPTEEMRFSVIEQREALKEELEKRKKIALEKAEEQKKKAPVVVEEKGPDMSDPLTKEGYEIFMSTGKCTTCHGKKAEGMKSQKAPRLAGQHAWYLKEQLVNFKSGARVNENMVPYLKNLTEKDFEAVSHYLSQLK